MVDLQSGMTAIIATVIILLLELVLFPIVLIFMTVFNASSWLGSNDRTLLATVPTVMIVVILLTVVGGVAASGYMIMRASRRG